MWVLVFSIVLSCYGFDIAPSVGFRLAMPAMEILHCGSYLGYALLDFALRIPHCSFHVSFGLCGFARNYYLLRIPITHSV